MKKIISIMIVCLCVVALAGCGFGLGTTFYGNYADAGKYSVGDFTYNAEDVNTVEINWVGGEIEIVQSENATLSVTENGDSLDSEEQIHHYIRAGKLIIHYCESGHRGEINSAKKKLRVEIPEGVDLDIDNVSADITFWEINVSDFELTDVSGDVTFAGITAKDIDIEIVSGKIDAKSVCARAFSVNGVSGNINAAKIDADEIDIEIVSGKTELVLARACEIDVSGVSGNVGITLPSGVGAEVELDSVSGDLHSDISCTKNGDTYVFGGGEAKIDVETVSGELYIKN
jgi:DUF4097 and DUF4098 domain-containing protein YvlB